MQYDMSAGELSIFLQFTCNTHDWVVVYYCVRKEGMLENMQNQRATEDRYSPTCKDM